MVFGGNNQLHDIPHTKNFLDGVKVKKKKKETMKLEEKKNLIMNLAMLENYVY